MEIRNYTDYGIFSQSSSTKKVDIKSITFKNIGSSHTGQFHGAIIFWYVEDVEIKNSYFQNVASGIHFWDANGPIKAVDNEALNSGRNFFQCVRCNGGEIRVNGNSMDRISSYGNAVLEDWISMVDSEGSTNDWIQVNNNRARGHSNSYSGSFTILGDAGGKNQKAEGNIGVSPGQVGIGAAGGEHINVGNNKMYSTQWTHSNVAFYSEERSSPCNNHIFPTTPVPNKANWKKHDGTLNRAWSDGNCGITNTQIRNNVNEDTSMGPEIWNEW